jgi:hypothetical protein
MPLKRKLMWNFKRVCFAFLVPCSRVCFELMLPCLKATISLVRFSFRCWTFEWIFSRCSQRAVIGVSHWSSSRGIPFYPYMPLLLSTTTASAYIAIPWKEQDEDLLNSCSHNF